MEENELTITAIFQQHTKEETIQTLKEALEVLEQEESDPENDPENDEMIEIINSTVGKLQQIEDKYYYSLDLNYYLNNLEDDAYEA
ncbi:transposon-transfer assisting family protein [Mediterraneibacter gnavus]|uniref:transposon-transfer assisting family protein n=1 Tax=Mediterraneibacter gnavus TaxID=33038 RepID=UPI0036F29871